MTGRPTFSLCGIYFSCQSKGEAPGLGVGQGRSQDFSKGGDHTVSNIIVLAFSPRNIVGCLLKKGLQRGGHGHPRTAPRYALGGGGSAVPGPKLRPIGPNCRLKILCLLKLFLRVASLPQGLDRLLPLHNPEWSFILFKCFVKLLSIIHVTHSVLVLPPLFENHSKSYLFYMFCNRML